MTAPHPAFISNRYYTVAQVAKKTGLSRSYIYEAIKLGTIPASRPFQTGAGRPRLCILRSWLDEHLDAADRVAVESVAIDTEIADAKKQKRAA